MGLVQRRIENSHFLYLLRLGHHTVYVTTPRQDYNFDNMQQKPGQLLLPFSYKYQINLIFLDITYVNSLVFIE
jgi:hypothetical protein